jgi:hypothetical protein
MLWPIELTIRGAPGRNRTGTTFGHRVKGSSAQVLRHATNTFVSRLGATTAVYFDVHKWRSNNAVAQTGSSQWVAPLIACCCVTELANIDILAALCALHQAIGRATRAAKPVQSCPRAARLPTSPQAQVVWWAGEVRSKKTTEACSSGAPGRSRTDTSRGHCVLRTASTFFATSAKILHSQVRADAHPLHPPSRSHPLMHITCFKVCTISTSSVCAAITLSMSL